MTRKWAGTSKGLLFASGLLAGLIFLFLVPRDAAGQLQLTYARVFRWPLAVGSEVMRVSQTTTQVRNVSPKEHEELLQAYQQLWNGSANLQAQLQEAQSQIERLTRLRAKPGLERMQAIPAKVITPAGQAQNELIIDQGQDSGVAVDQYVMSFTSDRLNDQCVIGTISSVSTKGAKVKLVTHSTSHIPARIGKLTVHNFLEGRGDGTARIPLLPQTYAVQSGDIVYADEKRGFLNTPVVMGEVVRCKIDVDKPMVWDITVRPVCDLTTLSEVVVLKPASVP